MKYGKEFIMVSKSLPEYLQRSCINYKEWKQQLTNFQSLEDAIQRLNLQCALADRAFKKEHKSLMGTPSCYTIRTTPDVLLKYAELNAKTTYKVCKRIAKLNNAPDAMAWLEKVRTSHSYAYLGSRRTTHLRMIVARDAKCPICMEGNERKPYLILPCGHYLCLSCAKQITQTTTWKGTWFNLLSTTTCNTNCPICRMTRALNMTSSMFCIELPY